MSIADDIAAGYIHPNTLEETAKGCRARLERESAADEDAQAYWDVINAAPNAWGAHCCPKTGRVSHTMRADAIEKHGESEFRLACGRVLDREGIT